MEGIVGKKRRLNEGKPRKMTGMIVNGGNRQINENEVEISPLEGVAVPYCQYGTEITIYQEGDITNIENVQKIVGR